MKYCPNCSSELVRKEINEAERLCCGSEQCDYVFWDNPVPVVGIIVEHNNKVILANNVNWPRHWFSIITGFLEKQETPEQCVVREVKEELNLEVISTEFVGLYSFFRFNQLIVAYHVQAEGEVKLNEELHSYKHIAREDLRPWRSETGYALRDWLIKQDLYREEDGYIEYDR